MRSVYLYGHLAEEFGPHFELEVGSVVEALRLLQANFKNFFVALREGSYRIVRGAELDVGTDIQENELGMRFGVGDFHIAPVIAGSKSSKGLIQAIVGVVLIAAAVYFSGGTAAPLAASLASEAFLGITYGNIAMMGVLMTLGGIGSMLTPTIAADYSARDNPKNRQSFLFNGAVNTLEQGGPVPLIYGECFVGSIVVSAGIDVEDRKKVKS